MSQPEPQPERPETGSDVGQVLRGSEAPRLDASQLWVSKVEGSIRASEKRYLFSSRTEAEGDEWSAPSSQDPWNMAPGWSWPSAEGRCREDGADEGSGR